MYDYEEYEERPRHRKTILSKKTKKKKADHKHMYSECIVRYEAEDELGKRFILYSPAKYCTICGNLECGWQNLLTLNKTYQNLKVFNTEMFAKKVDL